MDDSADKIKAIQQILGVTADGIWGPKSQGALAALTVQQIPGPGIWHAVKATSFADPLDVARFKSCKEAGGTDEHCFDVGDNGEGYWGDDTTLNIDYCALPPDDMIERWGSVAEAKHRRIQVNVGTTTIECILADTMPWRKDITNGAGIDLNPQAVQSLGQKAPLYASAMWRWA